MDVIYYILLGMVGLYVIWIALGNLINRLFKFKICAICATVVSTWVALLIMKLSGVNIPQVILSILMGQSIVGFMYLLERRASSTNNNRLRLMKPAVVIFGTLAVYLVINGVYQ